MGLEKLLENTPEAYYWAGFIMADGSIDHEIFRFTFKLSIKDRIQIEKFCKFSNLKFNIINSFLKYKNKIKNFPQIITRTSDKKNLIKLIKKFNFKPRKTYNPPNDLNIKNNDLFIAFMIGYIDGDGSISKKHNYIKIGCHKKWKYVLQKWFDRIWKLSKCEILNRNMHYPKVYLNSYEIAIINISNYKFVSYLKNKAIELNLPFLKRKWERIKPSLKFENANTKRLLIKKYLNKNLKQKEISKILNIPCNQISFIKTNANERRYMKSRKL